MANENGTVPVFQSCCCGMLESIRTRLLASSGMIQAAIMSFLLCSPVRRLGRGSCTTVAPLKIHFAILMLTLFNDISLEGYGNTWFDKIHSRTTPSLKIYLEISRVLPRAFVLVGGSGCSGCGLIERDRLYGAPRASLVVSSLKINRRC